MAIEDNFAVFIITDSAYQVSKTDSSKKEIVKISALPQGRFPDGFTSFGMAGFVGHPDFEKRLIESIKGDANEVTIKGLKVMGFVSIPFEEKYVVGEEITAEDIVQFEQPTKQAYATITELIYAKTIDDAMPLLNWGKKMETIVGGPIKMAEQNNSATMMKAESHDEDLFGAEYENHIINLYHSLYRSEREYEANV